MLTSSDFIHLPYPADLTRAGVAYACRSLPHTYNRMGGSPVDRLRRIVAGVSVELAFRHHLVAQAVPHDTLGATPFTDPDHYDIALGGRRCDVKSFQFFNKAEIRRIRREPQRLMQAAALIPRDQLLSEHLQDRDLYIFAFATALITPGAAEIEKAWQAGQPVFLISPMPQAWNRPAKWSSLGRLALKSDSDRPITVEVGGQRRDRSFHTERVVLHTRCRTSLQGDFYSLAYLRADPAPTGRLGLHSSALDQVHIILPKAWGNIWVYGLEIILAGYMTRGEFRRRAEPLPAGSRVLQYPRTRTENFSLPVAQLNPLGELFERVKEWKKLA